MLPIGAYYSIQSEAKLWFRMNLGTWTFLAILGSTATCRYDEFLFFLSLDFLVVKGCQREGKKSGYLFNLLPLTPSGNVGVPNIHGPYPYQTASRSPSYSL